MGREEQIDAGNFYLLSKGLINILASGPIPVISEVTVAVLHRHKVYPISIIVVYMNQSLHNCDIYS